MIETFQICKKTSKTTNLVNEGGWWASKGSTWKRATTRAGCLPEANKALDLVSSWARPHMPHHPWVRLAPKRAHIVLFGANISNFGAI